MDSINNPLHSLSDGCEAEKGRVDVVWMEPHTFCGIVMSMEGGDVAHLKAEEKVESGDGESRIKVSIG